MSLYPVNLLRRKKPGVATIADSVLPTVASIKGIIWSVGNGDYKHCFTVQDSSIICDLPVEYFTHFNIPENTKIEMKFITERN